MVQVYAFFLSSTRILQHFVSAEHILSGVQVQLQQQQPVWHVAEVATLDFDGVPWHPPRMSRPAVNAVAKAIFNIVLSFYSVLLIPIADSSLTTVVSVHWCL